MSPARLRLCITGLVASRLFHFQQQSRYIGTGSTPCNTQAVADVAVGTWDYVGSAISFTTITTRPYPLPKLVLAGCSCLGSPCVVHSNVTLALCRSLASLS